MGIYYSNHRWTDFNLNDVFLSIPCPKKKKKKPLSLLSVPWEGCYSLHALFESYLRNLLIWCICDQKPQTTWMKPHWLSLWQFGSCLVIQGWQPKYPSKQSSLQLLRFVPLCERSNKIENTFALTLVFFNELNLPYDKHFKIYRTKLNLEVFSP